jgi:hypothetical protein
MAGEAILGEYGPDFRFEKLDVIGARLRVE